METTTVRDQLLDVFRRALNVSTDIAPADLVRDQCAEWDSIGHMELVMDIEQTFGIALADADVFTLDTFDRALELVRARTHSAQ